MRTTAVFLGKIGRMGGQERACVPSSPLRREIEEAKFFLFRLRGEYSSFCLYPHVQSMPGENAYILYKKGRI
jgi:hypothetical protein